MTENAETKFVAALLRVEGLGDVAPVTDHAPSTMITRLMAIRADLMRWDAVERCYFLTPRGYERIRSASINKGMLLPFRAPGERRAG
jgi:hypothetical protein